MAATSAQPFISELWSKKVLNELKDSMVMSGMPLKTRDAASQALYEKAYAAAKEAGDDLGEFELP